MEPILLYGHPAGSSMGLVAALEWLGQPYRLSRVDMLEDMRWPSYGRINGRHETPVLITETGQVLSETMAITAWMEARDHERRISFAPLSAEAGRMHQLLGFVNTGFTGAFSPLWHAMEAEGLSPETVNILNAYGRDGVIERHDKLEAMIGDAPFLVGDRPSLADGVLIGVARWLEVHQVAEAGRWPTLYALRQRLEALPAVQFATAIEFGDTPVGSGAMRGQIELAAVIEEFGSPA